MLKSKNKETIKSVFEGPELQMFASVIHVDAGFSIHYQKCFALFDFIPTMVYV